MPQTQMPMPMPMPLPKTLQIGHSPDPDDAFMWYPLANSSNGSGPGDAAGKPRIDTGGYHFVHVLQDIQTLNDRCLDGDLEISALSIAQYPYVADRYALTSCGASMGDGYGPMVVTRQDSGLRPQDLAGVKIAVPGRRTSAFMALSLWLEQRVPDFEVVMFDEIIPAVVRGDYKAGLIIHEGQLTYADAGLVCLIDLGKWWTDTRGLPLPLGGNAIRRDMGEASMRSVCTVLKRSIQHALAHRDEAIAYALNYARDMGRDLADRFVGMYVNALTLDYGQRGREAVRRFLTEAADQNLVPRCDEIDFVEPAANEA